MKALTDDIFNFIFENVFLPVLLVSPLTLHMVMQGRDTQDRRDHNSPHTGKSRVVHIQAGKRAAAVENSTGVLLKCPH
jgi:hypothetical protein